MIKSWLRLTAVGLAALGCCGSALYATLPQPDTEIRITNSTTLWDIMVKLGKIRPSTLDPTKQYSPEKGRQLLERGFAADFTGKVGKPLSSRYTCTSCHTIEREHFSASTVDAQKRLEYSDSVGVPFLPGAPLYGVVNRVMFFNDDFQTKFKGDMAATFRKAHIGGLREAIQTCNQVFAKGRKMEDWEIESILSYFWTMELKMGDLRLDSADLIKVEQAVNSDKDNARAVNILRRYYNEFYPSHLPEPLAPEKRRKVSPVANSFTNGWRVYKWSCLYCHQHRRNSRFALDVNDRSFKLLKKNFEANSRYSIYDLVRYHPGSAGNRTGMPLYTAERMSDQQLQDLRFFIIQMANMGEEAFAYYRGR